jgi:hypothetical protein
VRLSLDDSSVEIPAALLPWPAVCAGVCEFAFPHTPFAANSADRWVLGKIVKSGPCVLLPFGDNTVIAYNSRNVSLGSDIFAVF